MKRKIKYEKPKLYLCNADKRPQCRGAACYKNGGPCRLTAQCTISAIQLERIWKEGDL